MQKATLRQIMSVRMDIISFLHSKQISSFVFRPTNRMKNYPHLQNSSNEQTVLEFNNEHKPLGSHGQMALFSFFNRLGIRCYMNTIPVFLKGGLNNKEKALQILKRYKDFFKSDSKDNSSLEYKSVKIHPSGQIEVDGNYSDKYEEMTLNALTHIFNYGNTQEVNDLIDIFEQDSNRQIA